MKHPVTPDGRYFVVRGRLWRMANPTLDESQASRSRQPVNGRPTGGTGRKKAFDREAEADARRAVDEVKRALGERGPVWWDDGASDLNRHMVKNTPYADWYVAGNRAPSQK